MSLKVFHIIFITASTLLAFGFGVWSLKAYSALGGETNLAFGITSLLAGVGLICYGLAVWKKLQKIDHE